MELSNYEIIRYPSGQLVITRVALTASGTPLPGPRDVVGVYSSEQEAQTALRRLAGVERPSEARAPSTALSS